MSATHDHTPIRDPRHARRLAIVFAMVIVVAGLEFVGSAISGSLALLSDAGHMATDALGLGMALAAIAAGRSRKARHRTYGLYRLEILAALANAALLIGVASYVIVEAIKRLGSPQEVTTGPMLVIALIGLVVNAAGWLLLRADAGDSINLEGALLEIIADLVASVGVVIAAVVIRYTGWDTVDPILGILIGLYILPRAWNLGGRALRILVQAAPTGMDLDKMEDRLAKLPGVVDVHDLHVWTLTSGMDVASVHLMIKADYDYHAMLDTARAFFSDEYNIEHATLQVEPESHDVCHEVTW